VKVVILCGGQGTRMREETEFRPKPLVEVGGRPILLHIMKSYAHHGFNEFVLCLGYRGNMIKEHFLNYEAMNNDFTLSLGNQHKIRYHGQHDEHGFTVTLADTGLESMTGKRVKAVQKYVDGDTFMLTYGDGVSDVDFKKVLAFHKQHGKLCTVTTVKPLSRFGVDLYVTLYSVEQKIWLGFVDGVIKSTNHVVRSFHIRATNTAAIMRIWRGIRRNIREGTPFSRVKSSEL